MKYVSVLHSPDSARTYWFRVPEKLDSLIHVGSEVMCNTKKGYALGVVTKVLDGFSEDEVALITRVSPPYRDVIAAWYDFKMDSIKVPKHFLKSDPSPEKIGERMNELYKTGKFSTPVFITTSGELLDGYTAYLVARMFGHTTLKGFCVYSEGGWHGGKDKYRQFKTGKHSECVAASGVDMQM